MKKIEKAIKRLYRDAMYYHLIRSHYSTIHAKFKTRHLFR